MFIPVEVSDVLAKMEAIDAQARIDKVDHWVMPRSLHKDSAQFLRILVMAVEAKKILEIGTSVGYSTIHLALGVKHTGGHLTTLELLPAKYEQARENLASAGLSHLVTQRLGNAIKILPTIDGPWDLVFVDLEKDLYEKSWELFKDDVKPGGVVVADNVVSHAEDLAVYQQRIRDDERFDTVTVPIGQGLEVSYKCRLGENV